jgi:hypothetical protein
MAFSCHLYLDCLNFTMLAFLKLYLHTLLLGPHKQYA